MSKIFYSSFKNSWYPEDFLQDYTYLPDDLIEISESVYEEFVLNPSPVGKKYKYIDGKFQWVDIEKSPEEFSIEEKYWRDCELQRADYELNKVQDSDPKAIGTVGEWRNYRKELRNWPENKDFPDQMKRPISPDGK